jgi:arylsulfatase A-like enzyme
MTGFTPNQLYSEVQLLTYASTAIQNHIDNLGYDVTYTSTGGATVNETGRSSLGSQVTLADEGEPDATNTSHRWKSAVLPDVLADASGNLTFTFAVYERPDATTTDLGKLRSYIDGVVVDDPAPTPPTPNEGLVYRDVTSDDIDGGWTMRTNTTPLGSIETSQGKAGDDPGSFDLVMTGFTPNRLFSGVRILSYASTAIVNHMDNLGYDVTYASTGGTTVNETGRSSLGTQVTLVDEGTPDATNTSHRWKSAVLPDVLSDASGNLTFTFVPYERPDATTTDRNLLRSYIDGVVVERPLMIDSFTVSGHRIAEGQSTTLSWKVIPGSTVSIQPGVGDVTAQTSNGLGSVMVTPADTTTYTLTVVDGPSTSTATTGVRVIGAGADTRPNIVLFLVDDMGWQDTSVEFHSSQTIYNRRYITPSMETLASKGVKFTNAYSAGTICQASRFALMSGLLPASSGYTYNGAGSMTTTIRPPVFDPPPIDNIDTIPRSLQSLGYRTVQIGKWHITGTNPTSSANVLASGFDDKIAVAPGGQPGSYTGTYGAGGSAAVPDLEAYHDTGTFLSEALTLEANKVIDDSVSQGKPFFLNFCHYAVHTPIQNDSRFDANYDDSGDGDHYVSNGIERSYATLVQGMDKSLGDVMAKLDALGVAGDTLIVFSSDHGGLSFAFRGTTAYPGAFPTSPTSAGDNESHNYPLRYGKSWTYEGGIRVPTIIGWSNPDPANPIQTAYPVRSNVTDDRFVSQLDFFPTLLAAAGGAAPGTVDGYDVSHYLSGTSGSDRPVRMVWHQPHYRADHNVPHNTSFRLGNWKVHYRIETGAFELYDLSTDISEINDLSASHPRELALLTRELVRELERVGARYPTWIADDAEIRPIPVVDDSVDSDFDGIPDAQEDLNGNGLVDPGETDPSLFDDLSFLDFRLDLVLREALALRPTGATGVGMKLQEGESLSDWSLGVGPDQVTDNFDGTETLSWPFSTTGKPKNFFRVQIENLELKQLEIP